MAVTKGAEAEYSRHPLRRGQEAEKSIGFDSPNHTKKIATVFLLFRSSPEETGDESNRVIAYPLAL